MTDSPLLLESLLPSGKDDMSRQAEVFALLALGVLDAFEGGALSPDSARKRFFNGANCPYTHRALNRPDVEEVMSRGAELPDLFDALSLDDATHEAQEEIAAMRAACLRILTAERLVA